ncbi:MAG: RNA polymerase sigma factor [bacterium]|nr:RNA polymerase sigma factor [bacterium]
MIDRQQEIDELKSGSEPAYRKLVENHLDQVINICYRFTLNRVEAEDLAQETFVEVYFSVNSFRGDSSLATWIHQIAVRKSLDLLRSKNRVKRKGTANNGDSYEEQTDVQYTRCASDPHQELEFAERRAVLQSALDILPANQRTSFVLSKCEDMSYEAIAEVMNTSVSSVTSLIHRAKQNLRAILIKHYSSQPEQDESLMARNSKNNRLTVVKGKS